MEIVLSLLDILILGLILISPVLLLFALKKLPVIQTLLVYSVASLLILGVLIWIFAWWGNRSDMILLDYYGYNFDGWSNAERFQSVAPENIDKVKRIETGIMGIGWPLKAIFGFSIAIPYTIVYIIVVYIGKVLMDRVKNRGNRSEQTG